MQRDLSGFRNVLFLDPGLGGTGWAFFRKLREHNAIPPDSTGVIRGKGETWVDRCLNVAEAVHELHIICGIDNLVMEFPESWEGSAVSLASSKSGALGKLTFLCGCIGGVFGKPGHVILMAPMRWKGQLPKDQVINRIKRRWPDLPHIRDHEGDAIGMGLSAQGAI